MQRKAYRVMELKSVRIKLPGWAWNHMVRLLGDPPALVRAREEIARLGRRLGDLERERDQAAEQTRARLEQAHQEVEQARNDRLAWQAKEASARKELQDCQARGKDLLEQVVQLTHKQRATQKSLLDQQFKSETTPLERNRFEMELTEARGNARRAEERAKKAEEALAGHRKLEKRARRDAARLKELETRLAWTQRQHTTCGQALEATIEKVRELEEQLARLTPSRPVPVEQATGPRRPYRKPSLRSRQGVIESA